MTTIKKPTVHNAPRPSMKNFIKGTGKPAPKAPCQTCQKLRKVIGLK